MDHLLHSQGACPPSPDGTPERSADAAYPENVVHLGNCFSNESASNALFRWSQPQPSSTDLLDSLLSVQEYERQRIAEELHDSAGQLLVALELSVAQLRRAKGHYAHDSLIEEIAETARQIEQEIRSLAFLRYPVELGNDCLWSAVRSLALGFGRRTGIRTTFRHVGEEGSVDGAVSMAFLRVTQEALANIHRHSHATTAKVVLEMRRGWVRLTIYDDGIGFPSAALLQDARGIGLRSMRHRIETVGGHFAATNLKRGARISAAAPASTPGSAGS